MIIRTRRKLALLALLFFTIPTATAFADLSRPSQTILLQAEGSQDSPIKQYRAVLSGSDRFSVDWRRAAGQTAGELAVDADGTFSYVSDGIRLAVLPSGVPVNSSILVSTIRAASIPNLTVESNRLESREQGNEWSYEIEGETALQTDTLQSDAAGNSFIQGSSGNWYSVDRHGKERFSIRFGDEPSRAVPICKAAPSGDSVCLSTDWGLIGIREQTEAPRLFLNGRELFLSSKPIASNGSTLVPLRGVLEKLGATVQWDTSTQTVTVARDNMKLKLKIGVKQAVIGGHSVTLAAPAMIADGKVYVPLRVVSETIGSTIVWEGPTKSIQIVTR